MKLYILSDVIAPETQHNAHESVVAYSPQNVNHRSVVQHMGCRKTLHTHQFGSPVVQHLRHNRCVCTRSERHW